MASPSFPPTVAADREWTLADFDFELPAEFIAQHPTPQRSASRLLDGRGTPPVDRTFRDLPGLLDPRDLLVFNDTRVVKARLIGRKATGGAVEVLVERVLPPSGNPSDHRVLAHLRASKSPAPGTRLRLGIDRDRTRDDVGTPGAAEPGFDAEVIGRGGPDRSLFELRFAHDAFTLLERHGHMPLPPYIDRGRDATDDEDDERRYQTVFAARPGAVAAPTAALHFDEPVLAALAARGVSTARLTLHVGAGTFQPVRVERIAEHTMHHEWFEIPADTVEAVQRCRERGGRVVAVGTTTLRALESAARDVAPGAPLTAGARDTGIFITPGFEFRVVDRLVTNFHLPRSTLMMLVSAFAGHDHVMALYRHAIAQRYRFFSYGDSMLLARA